MRRKYNDLLAKRAGMLTEAETLLKDGKREDYKSKMAEIGNINDEITEVKAFIDEQDRQFLERKDDPGEEKDKAAERGNTLMKGGSIALSAQEVRKGLYLASKSVTLATTTLVEPTGAGRNIRDGIGNMVSSIIDQVYVQDLTGMGSFLEPYVISELDAKGGKVSTNAGKARTASSDPTFGVAKISAYELNTTSYVDRNISRLSPAGYYDKIYGMALRAMRRKACGLIANGDGQASPDMYGIKNAKNVAGSAIFASVDVHRREHSRRAVLCLRQRRRHRSERASLPDQGRPEGHRQAAQQRQGARVQDPLRCRQPQHRHHRRRRHGHPVHDPARPDEPVRRDAVRQRRDPDDALRRSEQL